MDNKGQALIVILKLLAVVQLLKEGYTLLTDMEPFLLPIVLVNLWLNVVLWRPRPEGYYLIITFVAFQFLTYLYWFVTSTFLLPIVDYSQVSKMLWGVLTVFYALMLGWTYRARAELGYCKTTPRTRVVVLVVVTVTILMFSGYLTMDAMGLSGHEIIKIPRENIFKGVMSPEGNYLVMHMMDWKDREKTILWDVRTRQPIRTLFERISMFRMTMSPDGKYVGISGVFDDAGIIIWDVHSDSMDKKVSINRRKNESISAIAFSADSKQIGYGTKDGIRIEELQGKGVISIDVPQSDLNTMPKMWPVNFITCFSPDNEHIVSARYHEVSIWNAKTKERIALLKSELSFISPNSFIEFSKDGTYLAIEGIPYESDRVGREGIEIWDIKKKISLGVYPIDSSQINAIAFSPDGNYLAIGTPHRKITLIDVVRNKQTSLRGTHPFPSVEFLAFSPDGKLLYSGGGDTIKIWHLR